MISVKITVMPNTARGPGWANICITGLASTPPLSDQSLRFSVQRNQDGRYLAERNDWSAAEVWHTPQAASQTADQTECLIGPNLVDELLADPRIVCRLNLRLGDQSYNGVMRMGPGLYPSEAVGHAPAASRQALAEQPTDITEPPETEIVVAPAPAPPAVTAPRRQMPVLLFLLLLAFIGIGAAWWLFVRDDGETVGQAGMASTSVVDPASLPPCSAERLTAESDDLAFLQACVSSSPSTEAVMAIIAAGKAAKRCDLIQRLYAQQAQGGNAAVGLAYAREFDPETFTGGCFEQADRETAVYWYQTVLAQQPDNSTVKARIEALESVK